MISKEKEILKLFSEYTQKKLDFVEYKKIKSYIENIDKSRIEKAIVRTKCCICRKYRELVIRFTYLSEPTGFYERRVQYNFLFYSPYFSLYDVFDNVLSSSIRNLRLRYQHEIKRSVGESLTEAQNQFLTSRIEGLLNDAIQKLKNGKLAVCHFHEKIRKTRLIEEMIYTGELDVVEIDDNKIIGLK